MTSGPSSGIRIAVHAMSMQPTSWSVSSGDTRRRSAFRRAAAFGWGDARADLADIDTTPLLAEMTRRAG
jgi:hypothetical protein